MASLTIRHLPPESEEGLRRRAKLRGCTLEALDRSILDEASGANVASKRIPHYLIEMIEPGEEVETDHRFHDPTPRSVDLK